MDKFTIILKIIRIKHIILNIKFEMICISKIDTTNGYILFTKTYLCWIA